MGNLSLLERRAGVEQVEPEEMANRWWDEGRLTEAPAAASGLAGDQNRQQLEDAMAAPKADGESSHSGGGSGQDDEPEPKEGAVVDFRIRSVAVSTFPSIKIS
uniref:Uncharacterized protein n=1 Tax=Aegilops tauschii TaxID=37682 RepID=N1QVK1_AEGTA